jgi:hypothetical protein
MARCGARILPRCGAKDTASRPEAGRPSLPREILEPIRRQRSVDPVLVIDRCPDQPWIARVSCPLLARAWPHAWRKNRIRITEAVGNHGAIGQFEVEIRVNKRLRDVKEVFDERREFGHRQPAMAAVHRFGQS